ncbi:MAG: peptidylprolyl isomerase [Clostridia bacterium]|nr:peptidylprolyl isomerase [Clostridia bacterium]
MSKKPAAEKRIASKNKDTVWSPVVKIVAAVCAVILVAAIVLAIVAQCGVFRRNTVVMKVGDSEISALEFNYGYYTTLNDFYYNYYYYLSYIGFNPSMPLKSQTCYFDSSKTWFEYFVDQTKTQYEEVYLLYNKALSQQFALTEESKADLDQAVADIQKAAKENKMSVNEYLAAMYGKNITLDDYIEFSTRRLISSDFYNAYMDGLKYEDADIEKYYSENKTTFDFADYYLYKVEIEKDEKEVDASARADAIKNAATSVDAFLAKIKELEGDTFTASDYLKENGAYNKDDEMSKWLFDAERKEGDGKIFEDGKDDDKVFNVVVFLKCARKEYQLASMRHILFQVNNKTDDKGNPIKDKDGKVETDDAEQKAEAEKIFQQWKDNGANEDALAALVEKNSDDTGSIENGGLYEDFDQDTMVEEITDWLWKEGRKEGDCEIVKTEYGYHIVYFKGYGEIKWKSDVIATLKSNDYKKYQEGLKSEFEITYNEKGFSQVG